MATTYTISGKLTQSDGTPLSSAVIKVLKKNLKTEEELGLFQTGNDGGYTINFDSETAPDIIVRAFISNREIASSGPFFKIPKSKKIDIVVGNKTYKGPSIHNQLIEKLIDKLEGMKLSSLNSEEMTLLSGKTGISAKKLSVLSSAESLSEKSNISKDFFFGLLNSGLQSDLLSLAIQPEKVLSNTIKKSVTKNEISESESVDAIIQSNINKLRTAAAKAILTKTDLKTSMYWMLKATPMGEKLKEQFLTTLYKNSNNYSKTFDELEKVKSFNKSGMVDKVRKVFEIGSLTANFSPIVRAINKRITGTKPLSSFSVYSKSDWKKFIKDNKLSVPATTEGKNSNEKLNNYAETLTRNFEKAFPGDKVKGKILADNPDDDVKKFFDNAADFDISKTNINTYLNRNKTIIKKQVKDFDKLTKELKQLQRLYRITPDENKYEKIKVLIDNDEDSGSSVVKKYTKTGFMNKYNDKLGRDVSEQIYKNAQNITSTATAIAGLVADKIKGLAPDVIGKITQSDGEIEVPDWETLFGSTSYCQCKECRSVLSPAAYLVDILEFINKDANADGDTPKDILFKRRPDIGNILLSCENTNTALPYIDLINEILEIAVLILNGATTDPTFSVLTYDGTEIDIKYQTTGTTQELQAMSEHTIEKAYDNILNNAIYPFGLPFLFWNKEGDVYIEKLGIPRHILLRTLQFDGGSKEPTNISVALVHLGISENERKIIAGEPFGTPTYDVYKLCGMSSVDWESLSIVDTFLEKMDITYDELLELQQVKFVNNFIIDFDEDDSSNCDITKAKLKDTKGQILSKFFFDKVHRFLRLRKKLGWDILDLNKTINALGETDFTDAFFIKLSNVKYLKDELKIDLVELLSWWSNINTDIDTNDSESRSFYEQLFLNKAVINPIPEGYIFTLSDDKTKLLDETKIIEDYSSAIASALNISSSDLTLLLASLTTTTLTLSSLSELHRKASAAKAFDVEVKEMLALIANLPVSPFDNSDLNPVKFFEYVTQIKDSEFSILQLDYLFRHKFESADDVAPTETAIGYILQDIQDGIKKIKSENTYQSDATGEVTQTKLQQILDEETTGEIIDIILERSTLDDAAKEVKIKEALPFLDQTVAKEKLISIDTTLTSDQRIQNRYSYLLPDLLKYIIKVQSIDLISQLLSDSLSNDLDTSQLLTTELVISPKDAAKFAFDVLTDTAFTDYTYAEGQVISRTLFPDQYDIYFLIDKSAQVLTGLGFNNEEIVWVYKNNSKTAWLDLNKLTLTEDLTITGLFKPWLLMYEFSIVNSKYRTDDSTMIYILEKALNDSAATVDIIKEDLISLAGWENADLLGTVLYNVTDPKTLGDAQAIYKLYEINLLMETAGVSSSTIMQWITADLSADQSRSIREAVKAKYSTSDWLNVAPGLRNKLRPLQRDALLSYIIQKNLNIEDENDVIDHYLIDVKMESDFLTARIKQACSSVQMFIQRSFMGLEEDVSLTDEEMKEQWEWMKYYRMWEANRKVFLWPENYLEPELRTTKSEIFEELESELLQDEINEENVERALIRYLEKMSELSNLKVVATYKQKDTDILGTFSSGLAIVNKYKYKLHVFAKSLNDPPEYYYRNYDYSNNYWSPWERVDLDIDSNFLIPVVISNRLYLFWPTFSENTMDNDDFAGNYFNSELINKFDDFQSADDLNTILSSYKDTYTYYEIKLAYSEYKHDKWSDKKISEVSLFTDNYLSAYYHYVFRTKVDQEYYMFTNEIKDGIIMINCIQTILVSGRYDIIGKFYFNFENNGFSSTTEFEELFSLDLNPFTGADTVYNSIVGDAEYELYFSGSGIYSESGLFYFDTDQNRYVEILDETPEEYVIPNTIQYGQFSIKNDFFYQDEIRRYLVKGSNGMVRDIFSNDNLDLTFFNFYHPYINNLIMDLNREGEISAIINREVQMKEEDDFEGRYVPLLVSQPYPIKNFEFERSYSYSIYNWELFYHIPMLIGDYLSQEQKFEEAQQWYHLIFNPLDRSTEYDSPQKFWQLKPFFEEQEVDDIYNILYALSNGDSNAIAQLNAWKANPFEPHKIAELRIEAYMKNTVMKYLDNLLAWGDSLFSLDTIESINGATQLYILGLKILGNRPVEIPSKETTNYSYNDLLALSLSGKSDDFSNFLIPEMETYILTIFPGNDINLDWIVSQYLYFCIPYNTDLLTFWDDFEDRMFKIRNSMNIEGVTRSLALYEPAIDPALLVKARASGIDLGSILSDVLSPLPNYRFKFFVQKGIQFCTDVQSLGGALLSALEKKDAESIALLRSNHELKILQLTKDLKKLQVDESEENYNALIKTKEMTEVRYNYYKEIFKISAKETQNLLKLDQSEVQRKNAQTSDQIASILYLLPQAHFGTTPGWEYGSSQLGAAANSFATFFRGKSAKYSFQANKLSINAGYDRRWDDWKLQEDLAEKEIEQLDKQIAAAEVRKAIAEKDLENTELQMEQSKEIYEWMTDKYTNEDLYKWMVTQISKVYFQSYQLAYDCAKRAQRAFQYELVSEQTYIQYGYWNSLKKGLLAGEQLLFDLKRMEMAYYEQNKRQFEITKNISLTQIDPMALVMLRETGECFVEIPEALFDLDYPGHYLRRIKSVSLTIPCIVGPYTSLNCTLTLLSNKYRKDPSTSSGYEEDLTSGYDPRFDYNQASIQSIATSTGQRDSGIFQLNFEDDRYLHFEGAGAISRWRIQLPTVFKAFDYKTINDVIFHLSYTAKDGGETLKSTVNAVLEDAIESMVLGSKNMGLTKMFSLKQEFSNEWYKFLNPPADQEGQNTEISLNADRFPQMFQNYEIGIVKVDMVMVLYDTANSENIKIKLTSPNSNVISFSLSKNTELENQLHTSMSTLNEATGNWKISLEESDIPTKLKVNKDSHIRLNGDLVYDFILILSYDVSK